MDGFLEGETTDAQRFECINSEGCIKLSLHFVYIPYVVTLKLIDVMYLPDSVVLDLG